MANIWKIQENKDAQEVELFLNGSLEVLFDAEPSGLKEAWNAVKLWKKPGDEIFIHVDTMQKLTTLREK